MAKKIKKEDKKKLAKLKNIAKGKVSTKMYRGSRRGKVSTQVNYFYIFIC